MIVGGSNLKTLATKLLTTSVLSLLAISAVPSYVLAGPYHYDRVEVAFVLDTTGSMANLIEGAKRKIWSIANTVVDLNPDADIRMALVAYRDYGDDYVVRKYNMSSDIQGLYGNLIRFTAAGGGDTPEAVNEALAASIEDLDWSQDRQTKRMVFLVGDAPPHMDYQGPSYQEVIREAHSNDIIIHAVQAGYSRQTRRYWTDIAHLGGGDYIPIPQDGGQISEFDTPFDDEILELQRQLDRTVLPYGRKRDRMELRAKIDGRARAAPSVQVENSKFYAKRSSKKEVVTGGGDIISAIRNREISLKDVSEEELPETLQDLKASDRSKVIEEKIAEREELEKRMKALVAKHDAFVAKERKRQEKVKKADSFDEAVSKAISRTF